MIKKKEIIKSLKETAEKVQKMPRAEFVKTINEVDVETRWDADDIKTPPFTNGLKKIIQETEKLNEKCNEIDSEVNKWGRKRVCDVDDDL